MKLPKPKPRKVRSPWITCQAGKKGFRLAIISASAEARTGLLHRLLGMVHAFDEKLLIQACRVTEVEGIFHASLHIYTPILGDKKFDSFVSHVNTEFAKQPPVGWQIVTRRSVSLMLKGVNRNGLMYHVCEAVKKYEGEVTKFISKMDFGLPDSLATEPLDDHADMETLEPVLKIRLDVGLSNPKIRGLADDLLDLGFIVKKRG